MASQLLQWLRFNPNLAVLDLGCGDGAGSCAVIATLLDFRLRELLDPRPLQIHIIGVDVDSFGLEIYQEVVSALATEVSKSNIQVSFEILRQRLNDAGSEVESRLNNLRKSWGHPYLARLISIESNLNDYLEREHRINQQVMEALGKGLKLAAVPQTDSMFGVQLASFYRQLLELTPIDKIHVVTVDTKPDEIMPTIQTRLRTLESRLTESGHSFHYPSPTISQLSFTNPHDCYWRRRELTIPAKLSALFRLHAAWATAIRHWIVCGTASPMLRISSWHGRGHVAICSEERCRTRSKFACSKMI